MLPGRFLFDVCLISPYIYMQFRIVGYLPLVGAMFRYAESHIFSHHGMFTCLGQNIRSFKEHKTEIVFTSVKWMERIHCYLTHIYMMLFK